MAKLLLNSLEIRNFRAFRHLKIERLGRVNLITGRNNVGKSSLLEALSLYAYDISPSRIRELLESRNEFTAPSEISQASSLNAGDPKSIKYLFYGRREITEFTPSIFIGPNQSSTELLSLSVKWYSVRDEDEHEEVRSLIEAPVEELDEYPEAQPYLVFESRGHRIYRYRLDNLFTRRPAIARETQEFTSQFVRANGLSLTLIGQLWDNIALSPLEEDVLSAIRLIAPQVKRISIIGEESRRGRVPMISLIESDERLPLKSLGDGINRLFGIALALVNARDGFLLMDEVENGIHYSIQAELWDFIFQVANRLNVQVFATTHSSDCIRGFQAAAKIYEDAGVLIRLRNNHDNVESVSFDEDEVEIALRQNIEVRW